MRTVKYIVDEAMCENSRELLVDNDPSVGCSPGCFKTKKKLPTLGEYSFLYTTAMSSLHRSLFVGKIDGSYYLSNSMEQTPEANNLHGRLIFANYSSKSVKLESGRKV
jgi:hypothetical protein